MVKRVKTKLRKSRRLCRSPQIKAVINKVYCTNPRKPNSAQRKVARAVTSKGKYLLTAIKGVPHSLKKFSKVWASGIGFRDTPGVNLKLIVGKDSFIANIFKQKRRSFFGLKKPI